MKRFKHYKISDELFRNLEAKARAEESHMILTEGGFILVDSFSPCAVYLRGTPGLAGPRTRLLASGIIKVSFRAI